jgi:hypothetical protein
LPVAWMLMNNKSAESFGRPAFTFYAKIKGFFHEVANVDELAKEIGCPIENLRKTFDEYNLYADEREKDNDFKDPFGKCKINLLLNLFKFTFFIISRIPSQIQHR